MSTLVWHFKLFEYAFKPYSWQVGKLTFYLPSIKLIFCICLPSYKVLVTWIRNIIFPRNRRRHMSLMGWPWTTLVHLKKKNKKKTLVNLFRKFFKKRPCFVFGFSGVSSGLSLFVSILSIWFRYLWILALRVLLYNSSVYIFLAYSLVSEKFKVFFRLSL